MLNIPLDISWLIELLIVYIAEYSLYLALVSLAVGVVLVVLNRVSIGIAIPTSLVVLGATLHLLYPGDVPLSSLINYLFALLLTITVLVCYDLVRLIVESRSSVPEESSKVVSTEGRGFKIRILGQRVKEIKHVVPSEKLDSVIKEVLPTLRPLASSLIPVSTSSLESSTSSLPTSGDVRGRLSRISSLVRGRCMYVVLGRGLEDFSEKLREFETYLKFEISRLRAKRLQIENLLRLLSRGAKTSHVIKKFSVGGCSFEVLDFYDKSILVLLEDKVRRDVILLSQVREILDEIERGSLQSTVSRDDLLILPVLYSSCGDVLVLRKIPKGVITGEAI